jgi:hypothetical protein
MQVLYTTQSTLAYFAVNHGKGLANNAMTDAQRATLSPGSLEFQLRYVPEGNSEAQSMLNDRLCRVFGSKIQVVGWTTYMCLLGTLKTAVLVFYIRLMVFLHKDLWLLFCLDTNL